MTNNLLYVLLGYLACSVFSVLFNMGLSTLSEQVPFLWLTVPPLVMLLLALLVCFELVRGFASVVVLAIVILQVKSESLLLYFDVCHVNDQHSIYSGLLASVCLAVVIFLFVRAVRHKTIQKSGMWMSILIALVFEVFSRISFLSISGWLYSLFEF
ncbi:hypothetical protein [Roseivirga sp.]|uniref:hypothetical protein n=1 Tax=Roseivirga sp. TaxID=1964215 RepID=UPI003B521275